MVNYKGVLKMNNFYNMSICPLLSVVYFRLLYNHVSNFCYNIPRACLLNRLPVLAMDLKAIDQACSITC